MLSYYKEKSAIRSQIFLFCLRFFHMLSDVQAISFPRTDQARIYDALKDPLVDFHIFS